MEGIRLKVANAGLFTDCLFAKPIDQWVPWFRRCNGFEGIRWGNLSLILSWGTRVGAPNRPPYSINVLCGVGSLAYNNFLVASCTTLCR
jgi:hypothetical protein